jgi:hypothetical protein
MPGTVTLFGSGETSSTGGRVFETLAHRLPADFHISVLETPAGFEENAARVAGRVSDFLATRLQNYHPRINQVAARKKGTPYSPDAADVVAPMYESSLIFLGPGSPTYTVRQLHDSLAWDILQARHRLGASLVFASAAAIAAGELALPVYEIFKVGEDPHWKPGLNFFRAYNLALVLIPHWNNQDGGADLDTSRCFIGMERFGYLASQVASDKTILGIDELTALTVNFQAGVCHVEGTGSVHLLRGGQQQDYPAGSAFPIHTLGVYRPLAAPENGLAQEVWEQARKAALQEPEAYQGSREVPAALRLMIEAREAARQQRDWPRADLIRKEIAALGWQITDSPDGPKVLPR